MIKCCLHTGRNFISMIILSILLIIPDKTDAQTREHLLKAGYVEKFTHFVEWPEIKNSTDTLFRIAVIGDTKFSLDLEEIFKTVKVKDKIVKVSNITSTDQIKNERILFISESVNTNKLNEILNYTTGKQILTISEKKGYAKKGVIINMLVVDNYIRYEINRITLGKSRLKMSSLLLKSAILVSTDE
jgi:hypothetical protein